MLAGAVALAWLLGLAAILILPRDVPPQRPPAQPPVRIVLLPPVMVVPDSVAPAPPQPVRTRSQPAPSLSLMRRLLLAQPVAPPVTAVADTPPPPLLSLHPLAFTALARARPDTSFQARLHRTAWLRRVGSDSLLWQGLLLEYGRRANAARALARSLFGEDWLEVQPLVEAPARRPDGAR